MPDDEPGELGIAPLEAAQNAISAASSAVAGCAAGDADALKPTVLATALSAACAAIEAETDADAAEARGVPSTTTTGEYGTEQLPPPPRIAYASLSSLPPATLTLAQAAEVLCAVLQLAPPPLPWQGGPGLRACVGTHRVAALQLLCRLAALRCAELDRLLAHCCLLPRSVQLLFTCPASGAAAVAVAELLRVALRSPTEALWLPLFAPPAGGGDSLQARLAAAGTAAVALKPGSRQPHVGAVIAFANGVRQLEQGGAADAPGDEQPPMAGREMLRAVLAGDASWQAFCGAELAQLNEEQAGYLCGPRPHRPMPQFVGARSAAAVGAGQRSALGSFLGGRELLSMLRFLPS